MWSFYWQTEASITVVQFNAGGLILDTKHGKRGYGQHCHQQKRGVDYFVTIFSDNQTLAETASI